MLVGCHWWNRWLKRAPCAINLPEKKLFQARGRKDYGSIYTYTQTYTHTDGTCYCCITYTRFCSPQGRFQDFLKWGVTGGTGNKAHTRVFIINLNTLGLVCFSASCQRFIRCKEVLHTYLNIDYLVLDNCCVKWEIYLKSNIYSSKPSNPT